MAPLLTVENVSMGFGGVQALSDVSFDLHQGEILGLIGPNGAGKTTMFNCITGVLPGYKGHIRYEGRDLRHFKPHQLARLRIARTFQNLELFDELSALDNLLVPLDAFSRRGVIGDLLRLPTTVLDERKAEEEARSILHFLSLGDYADAPAGDLPVGLQRRLEIGRALCLEPRLLLLDEPAAGIDARETAELVGDMYEVFGPLHKRRSQLAGTLSGGEQQMLAIARGLIMKPRVLMIDEMSQGLAPTIVQGLFGIVGSLPAQGVSVLIVEQFVSHALAVASRAYVLEKGEVAYSGAAAALARDEAFVKGSYLGDGGDDEVAVDRSADLPLSRDGEPALPADLLRTIEARAEAEGRSPAEVVLELLREATESPAKQRHGNGKGGTS